MIINSKFRSLIFFFQFKIFYNEFKKNNKNRQQTTAVIHPLYNRQQTTAVIHPLYNRQQTTAVIHPLYNRQQTAAVIHPLYNRQQQSFIHCTTGLSDIQE
jgi:hypothetical protein